jgi:hypothetical protein
MARRRRKPPKQERQEAARLGRSLVALAAFARPGGAHGRRKAARGAERRRAIEES